MLKERKKSTIPPLIDSMRMLLEGLSTNSYHNLKNNVEQPVKLIFVLQYFWEYEENFHTKNICDTTCEDYTNIKFDGGDGCFGAVRDCEFKIRIHTTESQRLQVNIQIIFRPKTDGDFYRKIHKSIAFILDMLCKTNGSVCQEMRTMLLQK